MFQNKTHRFPVSNGHPLFKFKSPQLPPLSFSLPPPSPSRVSAPKPACWRHSSRQVSLEVLLFKGSRGGGKRGGLQKMTKKWHIHKGRGRSNSESNGPFTSISHTRNSSTLKQRAQGADFGYFRSVSLSALCDSSLLLGTRISSHFTISHSISPCLNAWATVIPIIISQSSRALCKPQPRFSRL